MVWIILGQRTKTERVPGGLAVERQCPSCNEFSTFYERRAVKTFRVYFMDVFDYADQRVMACGACGTLFATDEHGEPSKETKDGWRHAFDDAAKSVGGAVERAGEALGPMWEQAAANAQKLLGDASDTLGPLAKKAGEGLGEAFGKLGDEVGAGVRRLRGEGLGQEGDEAEDDDRPESEREPDPEKAALLRRFEELEKRQKGRK
jgi:hypothetical protein